MRVTPAQVRKLQRVFSAAVLLAIIVVITPYLTSGVDIQTTRKLGATRLIIVYERVHVGVDETKEITIRAVDDYGVIDTNRDDLLEVRVTSLSSENCLTRLSASTIRLQNGTAIVTLTGTTAEMLVLTVTWKGGRSELRSGETLLQVGSFEGT